MEYVQNLMLRVFRRNVSLYNVPKNKAIQLRVYGHSIINGLLEQGLKSGNKVKNQVNVPTWIKTNTSFKVACLRGLVDRGSLGITFNNRSIPLLSDFKVMCNDIQVKTSRITRYGVHMTAKQSIKHFIRTVRPMKWKLKKNNFLPKMSEKWITIFGNVV